jgi:endoglucanase
MDPSESQWLNLRGLAEKGLSTIRANALEKIILVGGLYLACDLLYAAKTPIRDTKVGYALHVYPQNADQLGKSWDIAFGSLSQQYPVLATELGYDDSSYDGHDDVRNRLIGHQMYTLAVIDCLEDHPIGWMPRVFDNALGVNVVLADNPFTPTAQESYFRSRPLYELEGSPNPSPVISIRTARPTERRLRNRIRSQPGGTASMPRPMNTA